jgi:hypothetical protein
VSNRWYPAPRVRPHVCHACRRGGAEHGPYFEDDWHYADPVTGSECRLYTCVACFANHVNAEGSPLKGALAAAQLEVALTETERDLADQAAQELREELAEARAAIDRLMAGASQQVDVNAEAVAEQLAAALEARWGTPPASWRERIGSRR